MVAESLMDATVFPADSEGVGIEPDPVFCQREHRDAGTQAFKKHLAQSLRYSQSYGLALGFGSALGMPRAVLWMPRLGLIGDQGTRLVCVAKSSSTEASAPPRANLEVIAIVSLKGAPLCGSLRLVAPM